MEQININTTKEKNKHLSELAIDAIINEYNEFNASVKTQFRKTVKNRQARIPSRNIGKTDFIKQLAIKYNTCTATIYNVIKDAKIDLKPIELHRMVRRKPSKSYKKYTPKGQRDDSIKIAHLNQRIDQNLATGKVI